MPRHSSVRVIGSTTAPCWPNVSVRGCLSLRPRAIVEADPRREHVNFFNWHLSGYYIPCNLGEISDYYRRFIEPPEIMVIKTRPMDANGYFNFDAANLWHGAVASRAKIVIVEVNDALPHVHGVDNAILVSAVDYIIDGDGQPAAELPSVPPTDADREVARLIAGEIEDGACLQIGIGAMPNAVCSLLKDSGVRDLGVPTEMRTDAIIDLYQAGVVTGARKTVNPVDLQGQAASESDGHRHISGTGGQLQFVRGGYASNGGKSFICLSSTSRANRFWCGRRR